jgi:tetratricopeptide (TPR) repeat protein
VEERIFPERIELKNLVPGRPVLIRSSYHPAWRSETGERIYRASPAFMLVFPKGESLSLSFGSAWPHKLGLALSGLGVLLSLVLLIRPLGLRPAVREEGVALGLDGGGMKGWLKAVMALLWAAGLTGLWLIHDDAASLRNRARNLSLRGDLAGAQRLFKQALDRFPMSLVVDFTCYDLAMTYVGTGQWDLAEGYFKRILDRFPDSILLPETLYHHGLCLKRMGRTGEAEAAWNRLSLEFKDSPWAGRARKAAQEG